MYNGFPYTKLDTITLLLKPAISAESSSSSSVCVPKSSAIQKPNPILAEQNYEIFNGLLGVLRDLFCKLTLHLNTPEKIRVFFGICKEANRFRIHNTGKLFLLRGLQQKSLCDKSWADVIYTRELKNESDIIERLRLTAENKTLTQQANEQGHEVVFMHLLNVLYTLTANAPNRDANARLLEKFRGNRMCSLHKKSALEDLIRPVFSNLGLTHAANEWLVFVGSRNSRLGGGTAFNCHFHDNQTRDDEHYTWEQLEALLWYLVHCLPYVGGNQSCSACCNMKMMKEDILAEMVAEEQQQN
ncbi:hypothetical protein FACS1894198_5830 [Clostridia bacterium]|nr:hypothetical protein FACS1894198_5830 [Clostridia bacterium]